MSNVVSISCTCEYLVRRAARHRRAGRYDEAMALLWKARNQFGSNEEIQLEMARVYDEIGCETEAARSYLRIVRANDKYNAQALFHLTLTSAQHGDIPRALSYFDRFEQIDDQQEISQEMVQLLRRQLHHSAKKRSFKSQKAYAHDLEKHAAASLQAGRLVAAKKAICRALKLYPTAQRYTMLACCNLLEMDSQAAVQSAKTAHALSPANVQTLCVLCDAYLADSQQAFAKKALALAALRANQADDLISVAVESAKLGKDSLTLQLTQKLLGRAPFHTRAMMLQACALMNLGKTDAAQRILGRLCGLLPEDTVCESYYRMLRDGRIPDERLTLGMDVTREEGINRAAELFSAIVADSKEIEQDVQRCARLCRLAEWAFRSPMAGSSAKTAALILLASLSSQESEDTLLDALTDAQIPDAHKLTILQVLTAKHGFHPYDADIGGKLVRLAAGGVCNQHARSGEANSRIVQRVADHLSPKYPDAPKLLLSAFLAYIETYGQPDRAHEHACAAALECWYLHQKENAANGNVIARRWGVSVRQMNVFLRRIESSVREKE